MVTMTIYGRQITEDDLDNISSYMDDEIREQLHSRLAPCSPSDFLRAYIAADPDILTVLVNEFDFKDGDSHEG